MKRALSLFLLFFAISASAQTSFTFVPEVKLGWANLKLDDNISSFNYGGNITIGIAKKTDNGNAITGLVFGRSQYTHTDEETHSDGKIEAYNTRAGSWLIGAQYLYRKNKGLIWGGIVGLSMLDKKYKVFYGEGESKTTTSSSAFGTTKEETRTIRYDRDNCESYDISSRCGFAIKGKMGYGWKHIYLLVEAGYNKGPEIGFNAAFPIFKQK